MRFKRTRSRAAATEQPERVVDLVAPVPGTRAEQQRADARWQRMLRSRVAGAGLVGVFKDITPGAEAQKATFAYERIREDEIGSEGDDSDGGVKKFIVFQDRRPNPLDDDSEPFTVSVPNPDLDLDV